jgi:hypothetical protein
MIMKRYILLLAALLAAMVATSASPGYAAVVLTDHNSTVTIDPESESGTYSWVIDGTDQLYQQWFWYRVGQQDGEHSIDTLGTPTVTNPDPTIAIITYSTAQLEVRLTYMLTGGALGSGQSDLAETIRIWNKGGSAIDFHFFQYSDFDLDGTASGDTLAFCNANTVCQVGESTALSETVVTPAPSHHEGAFYPSILSQLSDGAPTTLSDLPALGVTLGPGDATWAFQWDEVIAAGSTFIISKDKAMREIPEPCALVLWCGLGGLGMLIARRQRRGTPA